MNDQIYESNSFYPEIEEETKQIQQIFSNEKPLGEQKKKKNLWKLKRQFELKQAKQKLGSVREMMRVINQPSQFEDSLAPKDLFQIGNKSESKLLDQSNISSTSKSKIQKRISKLISLKKDEIKRFQLQNGNQEQDRIRNVIYDMIDEIHNSKHQNAFLSQPHFALSTHSQQKKSKQLRLSQTKQIQNSQKPEYFLSVPYSHRTLQSSKRSPESLEVVNNLKKIKSLNKQRSIIQRQRLYMNMIKNLKIQKKNELNNKNAYHTIDSNKTQTWSFIAQNSQKKISKILQEKEAMANEKVLKKRSDKYKTNDIVAKLIEQSASRMQNQKEQIKQYTKSLNVNKQVIPRRDKYLDALNYKGKAKSYYHIQSVKKSRSKSYLNDKQDSIRQILPEIKVIGKHSNQKITII